MRYCVNSKAALVTLAGLSPPSCPNPCRLIHHHPNTTAFTSPHLYWKLLLWVWLLCCSERVCLCAKTLLSLPNNLIYEAAQVLLRSAVFRNKRTLMELFKLSETPVWMVTGAWADTWLTYAPLKSSFVVKIAYSKPIYCRIFFFFMKLVSFINPDELEKLI